MSLCVCPTNGLVAGGAMGLLGSECVCVCVTCANCWYMYQKVWSCWVELLLLTTQHWVVVAGAGISDCYCYIMSVYCVLSWVAGWCLRCNCNSVCDLQVSSSMSVCLWFNSCFLMCVCLCVPSRACLSIVCASGCELAPGQMITWMRVRMSEDMFVPCLFICYAFIMALLLVCMICTSLFPSARLWLHL